MYMRRLIPFLILLAFLLDLSDGRIGRSHVKVKASFGVSSQENLYASASLPAEKLSDTWNIDKKLSLSPISICEWAEPSLSHLSPPDPVRPLYHKLLFCLGLGSGGLPS